MRCRRPVRRGVLTGAVTIALAAAAAGCGRDGDLADSDRQTPTETTTRTTERPTRTTRTTEPPTRTTRTTEPPTRTTRTSEPPTRTTPNEGQYDPFAKPPKADVRLRNTAVRYARNRFGVATRSANVTLRRSRRNPAWAIASGADGRTLWVVWLKDGAVALATTDVARFNPPSVPCDLRPAFTRPGC